MNLITAIILGALLISERDIPTTDQIWANCCSHDDCIEAERIGTAWLSEHSRMVKIDDLYPFPVESSRIFHSTNGKPYYCRYEVEKPPSHKNIRCIFITAKLS